MRQSRHGKLSSIIIYHFFSGCDYAPSIFGHGKIQFWDEMVKNIDSYRETFTQLSQLPTEITDIHIDTIKILFYAHMAALVTVLKMQGWI